MNPLLTVRNLHIKFRTQGLLLHAVRGIDFTLYEGETLGIVGESGCGKSATAKGLIRLNPAHTSEISGEISYASDNLIHYSEAKMQEIRGKEISMIFQDPMTSLNPTQKIGRQIAEGYLRHFPQTPYAEAKKAAIELLHQVGIANPEERYDSYPHLLSGGMRQRAMIALALACQPKILLADEPTTALDVTIQAQILDLLKSIQQKTKTSILLITHDMSVVARMCDRVLVMYAGQIVESATVDQLFTSPQHPYTRRLLEAIPRLHCSKNKPLVPIEGSPPNLCYPLKGCPFAARCSQAMQICAHSTPSHYEVGTSHVSACFLHDERKR